jgi:putative endonuclease
VKNTKQRGDEAERIAENALIRLGWRVLDRYVYFRVGEIDLVAEDPPHLVFVEVRSAARGHHIRPEDSVTRTKQHKLSRAARLYLARYTGPCLYARFDVIAVRRDLRAVVAHHRNAFEAIGDA